MERRNCVAWDVHRESHRAMVPGVREELDMAAPKFVARLAVETAPAGHEIVVAEYRGDRMTVAWRPQDAASSVIVWSEDDSEWVPTGIQTSDARHSTEALMRLLTGREWGSESWDEVSYDVA
jgi:hypothetical protein